MGFCINEEQKVNITLSEKANTIILDDWEIFSTFTLTGFLNTIIENFCEDAKASYTEYCNIQTKKFKDLTEKGKEFYRSRLNYRPQKINSESTEDEYVFSCTEQQAYVYFLSFGKDAEIIAPEKLRKRMKEFYESASNKYN